MLVRLADAGRHFEAVQFGHVDVEQHQIGPDQGKLLYGHATVSYIGHFITFLLQEAFQEQGVFQVVVGKKNFQGFHTDYIYLKKEKS
mgnify:CR=1 FL=1